MTFAGFLAVGFGSMFGCWLRWILGMQLNRIFPTLPLGTLAANLLGGLVMGCVMGLIAHFHGVPHALTLFVGTGFLGGLTTFSTFSAEASTLLLRRQSKWAAIHITAHLLGTLVMTMLGIVVVHHALH